MDPEWILTKVESKHTLNQKFQIGLSSIQILIEYLGLAKWIMNGA